MASFKELPAKAQMGIIVGVVVALCAGFYFLVLKDQMAKNEKDLKAAKDMEAKVKELEPYQSKLEDLKRQIASLQLQLDIQKRIVPDEKEADKFMKMMQDTAVAAGVEVRRYAQEAGNTKEFYTEVPFAVDVDGSYYALLNFFERVGKLERIINIGNLKVATVKKPNDAGVKGQYAYAPNESVVASCKATTFFSHEPQAAPPPKAPGKK
ncbi:MAG TPA: type 4a pilus biogenesis protein PilO [Terriglobales bacterium]|nr:type 4a pilus biogenesis protein PilO [Terriglobales bacterium]